MQKDLNFSQMSVLNTIPLSWLYVADDARFVETYLRTVEQVADSELVNGEDVSPMLKKSVSNLNNLLGYVLSIKHYIGRRTLTEAKATSNEARKKIGSSILNLLKAKVLFEKEKEDAQLLLDWIRDIAPRFPHYSRSQLSRYIGIISQDLDNEVEILESINVLGLDDYIVALILENDKFRQLEHEDTILFEQKNMSTSQKIRIRKDAYRAIQNFIKAVTLAMELDESGKFESFYFIIRKTIIDARTSYKLSRKRKTSDSTEDEMDVEIFNSEMDSAQQIDCDCSDIEEDYGDDEKIV